MSKIINSVFIAGPSGKLEAKSSEPESSKAKIAVVICHPHPLFGGAMENKVVTTLFRAFQDLGAFAVRFNFRGVGQSEGEYAAGVGETNDLLAVCEWVKQTKPEHDIWLAGFSFGSYIATRAANQVGAKQLLTVAPAVEHFDFDTISYPECPWTVIQGDADEVVPPQLVFDWIKKQAKPPKLIKYAGASHFFHGRLTDLKQTIFTEYQSYFV